MHTRLFTVIDAFRIAGRGTVVCVDLENAAAPFADGDRIEIVTTTGTRSRTKIRSFEFFRGLPPERRAIGVLLEDDLDPTALPKSEVFKIEIADGEKA